MQSSSLAAAVRKAEPEFAKRCGKSDSRLVLSHTSTSGFRKRAETTHSRNKPRRRQRQLCCAPCTRLKHNQAQLVQPGQRMSLRYILLLQRDLQKAVRFYGDGVGLPVRVITERWAELQAGKSTLALKASDG